MNKSKVQCVFLVIYVFVRLSVCVCVCARARGEYEAPHLNEHILKMFEIGKEISHKSSSMETKRKRVLPKPKISMCYVYFIT